MLSIGTFRKNVMKTVATKPAKLGLRMVSKNTLRTNVANSSVRLKTNTGALLRALNPYILGMQITQEMKDGAFVALGDMSLDLTILCRLLKVKMPTATKKAKLTGTRTAALLQLDGLTSDLLALVQRSLFVSPKMKKVKKMVVMPNKGWTKEERDVDVIDVEEDLKVESERQAQMRSILSGVVDIFWRLCFEMFGKPPVVVLEDKFKRMQVEYPGVQFDQQKDAPTEAA